MLSASDKGSWFDQPASEDLVAELQPSTSKEIAASTVKIRSSKAQDFTETSSSDANSYPCAFSLQPALVSGEFLCYLWQLLGFSHHAQF